MFQTIISKKERGSLRIHTVVGSASHSSQISKSKPARMYQNPCECKSHDPNTNLSHAAGFCSHKMLQDFVPSTVSLGSTDSTQDSRKRLLGGVRRSKVLYLSNFQTQNSNGIGKFWPFEDVVPNEHGDFPMSCQFSRKGNAALLLAPVCGAHFFLIPMIEASLDPICMTWAGAGGEFHIEILRSGSQSFSAWKFPL